MYSIGNITHSSWKNFKQLIRYLGGALPQVITLHNTHPVPNSTELDQLNEAH